jgi:hypothetical protein
LKRFLLEKGIRHDVIEVWMHACSIVLKLQEQRSVLQLTSESNSPQLVNSAIKLDGVVEFGPSPSCMIASEAENMLTGDCIVVPLIPPGAI